VGWQLGHGWRSVASSADSVLSFSGRASFGQAGRNGNTRKPLNERYRERSTLAKRLSQWAVLYSA
jgi:hypothetical protein